MKIEENKMTREENKMTREEWAMWLIINNSTYGKYKRR
jgi:hypothetical protein